MNPQTRAWGAAALVVSSIAVQVAAFRLGYGRLAQPVPDERGATALAALGLVAAVSAVGGLIVLVRNGWLRPIPAFGTIGLGLLVAIPEATSLPDEVGGSIFGTLFGWFFVYFLPGLGLIGVGIALGWWMGFPDDERARDVAVGPLLLWLGVHITLLVATLIQMEEIVANAQSRLPPGDGGFGP